MTSNPPPGAPPPPPENQPSSPDAPPPPFGNAPPPPPPGGNAPPPPPGYGAPPPGYGGPPPGYPGGPGGFQQGVPGAPYGVDPVTGQPYSEKSKVIAGVLGILLGGFGAGRFYRGFIGLGFAQLGVTIITCGLGGLWGVIEGILVLVNGDVDSDGRPLRPS